MLMIFSKSRSANVFLITNKTVQSIDEIIGPYNWYEIFTQNTKQHQTKKVYIITVKIAVKITKKSEKSIRFYSNLMELCQFSLNARFSFFLMHIDKSRFFLLLNRVMNVLNLILW